MKIAFRADSSKNIGSGHIFRCLVLANLLFKKGFKITFFTNNFKGNLIKHIPNKYKIFRINNKFKKSEKKLLKNHFKLWTKGMMEEDIKNIKRKSHHTYDWLIVDQYNLNYYWHKKAYEISKNLMVIDDLKIKNFCNVYLNYNYKFFTKTDTKIFLKRNCTKLIGTNYFLSSYKRKKRNTKNKKIKIFISMGSVDKNGILHKSVKILRGKKFNKYFFYVYLPKNISFKNSILNIIKKRKNFKFIKSPRNLLNFYKKIDGVISSAGVTMYEQLKFGFKPIIISQNSFQKKIAKNLNENKLIHKLNLNELSDRLPLIFDSKEHFTNNSESYKKLFSFNGHKKILQILKK